MTHGDQKQLVHFLLQQVTYIMLSNSPIKDAIQKSSESHLNRLRAKFTKEEYEPILAMRNIVTELAHKLARCESVTALEQTYAYIKALNDGEVMIAVETPAGEITYEPNA